jgi:hypothetical protein
MVELEYDAAFALAAWRRDGPCLQQSRVPQVHNWVYHEERHRSARHDASVFPVSLPRYQSIF